MPTYCMPIISVLQLLMARGKIYARFFLGQLLDIYLLYSILKLTKQTKLLFLFILIKYLNIICFH